MSKTKNQLDFATGQFVVYPSHGVGKITDVETQSVGDETLEMFVIYFEKEKMISEDELKRGEEDLQKLTDRFVEEINERGQEKEKEIMEV